MPTAPADGLKMADAERFSTGKRELVERLVPFAGKDNENFLTKIKDRLDRVGIENPTVEVRFERLDIGAEAYVGNSGVPSVLNFYTNMIEGLLNKLHILPTRKQPVNILNDISGIIKPKRMSLLLGPPGSGKTTLLLALAGKPSPDLKVSGKVTYSGHEMNEFVPQRTSAYVGQNDVHIGEMTVRETLAFSARCQGIRSRYELLMELLRREKEANIKPDRDIDMFMKATSLEGHENMVTEYIMKILGLDICADTMVGNAMLRGISGGQKKRVTIGEMLVGPSRAFFMDEISTGLDSSTTFQIVNSVRQSVHVLGATALIALLQPSPETYDLFDDVVLLSEGQIVYQGPRVDVLGFFESMGFRCPERKGVADFLQEVTSRRDQQQYWARSPEEYRFIPVNEFADAFRSCHVGRRLAEELGSPFDRTKSHPTALTTSRYGVSRGEMLKACFDREYLLMKRNSFVYLFRLLKVALVSFVAMTVFFRVSARQDRQSVGPVYVGALFVGLITHLLIGFAEVSMTIVKFPVFYKQRDLLFFPAWTYALPTWILKVPVSFVECGVYVAMTYHVIGFEPNIHRMLRQFFIYTLVSQVASGLFRLVAATGRVTVVANTFSILALVLLLALGGFVTSRENIKKWWIWGYWASPLMYGQNAIAVNEFLGKKWLKVNLTEGTETQGVRILESYGLFPEDQWFWIGVDGLLGYILLFNVLFIVALTYLNMIREQAVLSKESLEEKNANRTGQATDSSSRGRMPTHVSEVRTGSADGETEADMGRNKKKGMVLPFIPLSITFDDIKYSVDMPQEMKAQGVPGDKLAILKGLSGAFRPRVLTALMGPSGAGKTTLLDVLAGRKTGGYIEGRITISGYPKNQDTFARVSGYCEQNDVHSPHMTVYESLVYSAWLRLSSEIDSKSRKVFIEEVMGLVELMPLRESLVGLPGTNGLSTEQRKRLTIAVELVANPSIIFMDEPTSGLDARAAAIVMRTARNIVDTGRTIVCTIHQPSIDIFESFEELFLMKRGGDEIYVGPLGHNSCYLINYFESINGVKRIQDGHNPATWMLEVTTSSQEEALGVNFGEAYRSSNLYRRNKDLITELSTPPPGSEDLYFPTNFSQPFLMQCVVCLWKQWKSYWSNPLYIAIRMLFTTIIALIYGTIFWRLGSKLNTQQDVLNAMGSIYLAVIFIGMQNAQTVQPIVDVERTVFYREKAAGMYSSIAYAFAQVVVEIPYTLLQSLLYCVLVYSMIDFDWTVAKFSWFLFFMFFTFLYFVYYGMMAVALTPNSSIATVVATTFYAIWNVFAGFIIPLPRIPVWWRWYYWACPVSWSVYGLNASQFGDDDHMMDNGSSVEEFLRSYMGYRLEFLGVVASVVVGFPVLFAIIFAIGIKYVNFQRR